MASSAVLFQGVLDIFQQIKEQLHFAEKGLPPRDWDGWHLFAQELDIGGDNPSFRARQAAKVALGADVNNMAGGDPDWEQVEGLLENICIGAIDVDLFPTTQQEEAIASAEPSYATIVSCDLPRTPFRQKKRGKGDVYKPLGFKVAFEGQDADQSEYFSLQDFRKSFPRTWKLMWNDYNDSFAHLPDPSEVEAEGIHPTEHLPAYANAKNVPQRKDAANSDKLFEAGVSKGMLVAQIIDKKKTGQVPPAANKLAANSIVAELKGPGTKKAQAPASPASASPPALAFSPKANDSFAQMKAAVSRKAQAPASPAAASPPPLACTPSRSAVAEDTYIDAPIVDMMAEKPALIGDALLNFKRLFQGKSLHFDGPQLDHAILVVARMRTLAAGGEVAGVEEEDNEEQHLDELVASPSQKVEKRPVSPALNGVEKKHKQSSTDEDLELIDILSKRVPDLAPSPVKIVNEEEADQFVDAQEEGADGDALPATQVLIPMEIEEVEEQEEEEEEEEEEERSQQYVAIQKETDEEETGSTGGLTLMDRIKDPYHWKHVEIFGGAHKNDNVLISVRWPDGFSSKILTSDLIKYPHTMQKLIEFYEKTARKRKAGQRVEY